MELREKEIVLQGTPIYGGSGPGRLWQSKAVLYNTEIFKNFLLCLIFLLRDCRYKKLRRGKASSLQNVWCV